jgi:molybdopterin synthase catalytic subunit
MVSFVGLVRDLNDNASVTTLTLEHYPDMTEKSLQAIVDQAKHRWELLDVVVIHRVGTLKPTDQIVLVVVTSAHRQAAFLACEFVMDYLKTQAPFWKKETSPQGAHWVEAKTSDDEAQARWTQ